MRRRSNVDETARAVSAFFQEILGAGQTQSLSAFGSSPLEEREAISSRQFLHFFGHYKVFTQEFTHVHALQVYNDEADNDPDGVLDLTGFKTALGTVAQLLKESNVANRPSLHGSPSNPMEDTRTMASSPTKGQELAALDELVQEINSRRDFTIDAGAHALMTPLYDVEVVQATYSYSSFIRGLFNHYATADNQVMDLGPSSMSSSLKRASHIPVSPSKLSKKLPPAVNGRSFYRLCCALGMVPNCIVEGELSDMMAKRSIEGKGRSHTRSGVFGERTQMNSETRYFEENLMIDGTDEFSWQVPAKGFLPGEPRYSFPDLVESLVLAAFTVPPRPFAESTKVRVQRIHEIFSGALRLPSFPLDPDFLSKPYCLETISQKRVEEFLGEHLKALAAKKKRQPSNNEIVGITMDITTVFARLAHDLPNLPMRRDIHIPKPPPHKELPPQPETLDEKLSRPAGKRVDQGKTKGGKGKKKKKKGASKAAKKVKRKLGLSDMNKVIFYAKREPPKRPDLPPQLCLDRRAQMTEEMDMRLHQKTEELKALTVPRREGLRMTLIDESLRAPRCTNEEVSTLMETALTARRLRHYEEAIALLIRARTLWSAIEAGRSLPTVNWTDVQPLVLTPSPWGTGFVSSATRVTLTEGGRSARGDCSGSCRDALPGPEEKGMAIKQGNAVFRRFQTTCASAHLQRRTGATAALAAAAAAAAANGNSIEEGSSEELRATNYAEADVDRTILPEELARSSKGPPSSSKPPTTTQHGAPGAPMTAWASSPESSQQWPIPPSGSKDSFSGTLQPQPPPPRPGSAQGQRTSRPASAFSGRRYSKQSADSSMPAAPLATRRYSPQVDFHLAIGEDNPDLSKLPAEANIFFYCELASLHSAIREDERAVQLLWLARGPSDRLPSNHPDTAVVWCAFGRLAFLLGAFDIAARATSRGRKLRERILGGDTVETATSHNNLACCLFALDRPLEALAHLELAQEILKILAGEDHPRTQTALRNLEKARVAQKHLHAEVPNIFSFYVPQEKSRGRSRKKGKKKKGDSSRGSSRRSSSAASSRKSSRKGK